MAESQAFFDNFNMGNYVDRNDPKAVEREQEIAKLHKQIAPSVDSGVSKGVSKDA